MAISLKWINEFQNNTSTIQDLLAGVNAEQLNVKPNANSWSMAQVLDHLIIIHESYYPIFDAVRFGYYKPHWLARFEPVVNFFGKFILKSVLPSTAKKIKTLPIWEPAVSNLPDDILEKYIKHKNELTTFLLEIEGAIEKNPVISSPANKIIVYRLQTALDIMVNHEKRHIEQLKKIIAVVRNSKA